jgi:hypothetical protein
MISRWRLAVCSRTEADARQSGSLRDEDMGRLRSETYDLPLEQARSQFGDDDLLGLDRLVYCSVSGRAQ